MFYPHASGVKCNVWPSAEHQTIFDRTETPLEIGLHDDRSLVLGLQFTADKEGELTAFRYFKSHTDVSGSSRSGRIYSWPDGELLGSTPNFTDNGCLGGGWVSVALLKPISVVPNKVYVVAIDTLDYYVKSASYLTKEKKTGDLTARLGGAVFGWESDVMPHATYGGSEYSNYWIDGKLKYSHS